MTFIGLIRDLHVEAENLLFDHLRVLTFKGVHLIEDEEDAAAKGPNIDLLAECALLKDELRGRVVDMATEIATSQQLLEIVRQAYSVKLDDSTSELLDPTWVHVPVDIVVRMEVAQTLNNLFEHF